MPAGGLAGDLDGVLQEALGDDVVLKGEGERARAHEDPELCVLFSLCSSSFPPGR